jgi:hypothetical protein
VTHLVVLPDLAREIGLDEAIVLYRVHQLSGEEEHRHGIARSWAEWCADFPFWTWPHLRNTMTTLRVLGLVAGRTPASPELNRPVYLTETGRLAIATAMEKANGLERAA